MTNRKSCGIVQSETKNKSLQKGRRTMKTISSAIFYMSEWQAIFQCEEYSFCEARPYQDKQKNMIGLSTCWPERIGLSGSPSLNYWSRLSWVQTSGFFMPMRPNNSDRRCIWEWTFQRSTLLAQAPIVMLRKAAGLTVHDLQMAFGFNSPQAIYKWQNGTALPTVDNLIALAALLHVRIDDILITDHSVA